MECDPKGDALRVTQVVADGRPGGGTVMVEALVEALGERGHQVSLVTDAGSYAGRRGRELGAEVVEIPFFHILTASRALGAALRSLSPELIHVHGSRAAFHLARAGDWASRVPCHYTVHGYHFEHRKWPRRWIGRWAERRSTRRLSSVVHVCDYDRRLAETRRLVAPDSPRRVIYNGVDIDALPTAAPTEPGRVAFVGRLVPQKDPRLIAAIARLLADRGISVVIVGGGAQENEVRGLLRREIGAGRVSLTGEVDRVRALAELAKSSVLVLPSRWEGLPVAVLEALALGVRVVAAEVGGVSEALAGGRAGILVAGREAEAFAAAARRVLLDRDLGGRLAAAGLALVAERFSLASCLERYLRLYE
jgi:glycosyltransferase involved in cell wall biosynthesis